MVPKRCASLNYASGHAQTEVSLMFGVRGSIDHAPQPWCLHLRLSACVKVELSLRMRVVAERHCRTA
eukprot:1100516-Rhodomonas_salina.1